MSTEERDQEMVEFFAKHRIIATPGVHTWWFAREKKTGYGGVYIMRQSLMALQRDPKAMLDYVREHLAIGYVGLEAAS
jgi:hypothetical protein